jgi:phosphotriesterase-related protein
MVYVNTVFGKLPVDVLGVTLIHEHLCNSFAGWDCDAYSLPYDRSIAADFCVEAIEDAKLYGLNTLVDVTPIDLGRDVELQKIVSERTGINIISATGLYEESMGSSSYFKFRSTFSDATAEIYETFMKEITQGIGDTGVRPGVIKVGTGDGSISVYEEGVLRAAARANRETGISIVTHTVSGTMGPEQADLFIREGCDPGRIMIGHMCDSSNIDYHKSVLEKGTFIAFDRFGLDALVPDATRKDCIIKLVELGYADRIMLSHDYVPYFCGRTNKLPDFTKDLIPDWSFTHVLKNIIPGLKDAGLSDETVNTIMVDNPRRLLGVV